jgi:hypothetical protein
MSVCGCSHIGKEEKKDAPLLIAVYESRCNCADVRASTDQEENDEQQGLEIEERGLKWSPPPPKTGNASASSVKSACTKWKIDGPC